MIEYRVTNTTNEAMQVVSFADAAISSAGARFEDSMDCNLRLGNTLGITETLNPGMPRTFNVCFEVPPGTSGWVLNVNRMFSDGFLQTGV